MLFVNTGRVPRYSATPDAHEAASLEGVVWLDLDAADDAERSLAERVTGLRVPARADLEEIESSSRLASAHGALYLSMPIHVPDASGRLQSAPLGFVLSERYLLTVRYGPAPALDGFAKTFHTEAPPASSVQVFVALLEAIVDSLADVLEQLGATLDGISRSVFQPETSGVPLNKTDARLRETLQGIGRCGERLSYLRDSLLGIQRIAAYAPETGCAFVAGPERARFATLRADIVSLADYDTQLSNKVQFLLDATLGFINIEQNNGIKILTVVSVVGVPPTLVASIYGMNFKWIPELQWEYGYFYGLAVIVASAVLPLFWFKRKGWI